jgi:hypothetical protein
MVAFSHAALARAAITRVAFAAFAVYFAPHARAQEILLTGPLRGEFRGPPSPRANRIELAFTPGASFGANDWASLLAGGEAHYYPWDAFGAGAWGTWAIPVGDVGGETRLRAAISPELVVVPVTGKAVAFDDLHFKFDLHLLGGPAVAFTREADADETAWMPMMGVGFRVFCGRSWSKTFAYRILFGDPVRHLVTLSFAYWPLERAIPE